MKCPNCSKENLKKTKFFKVETDYCPKCLGIWFDKDELKQAKDEKDKDLNWLDVDLWQDRTKFRVSKDKKVCPHDDVPLYEVSYGDSGIKVDVCEMCQGVWLERGEFKKIIGFLKQKGQDEIMYNYLNNFLEEAVEIFTGPESFRDELRDFLTVFKLLEYRFIVHHPAINKIIAMLPK